MERKCKELDEVKKIIFALCLGILIGSTTTAIASTEYIQATLAKFNIQIDDKKPIQVEAIVNEGVSYYPIREIADLLNQEVSYIGATRTIVINTSVQEIESSEVEVEHMTKYKTVEEVNYRINSLNNALTPINFMLNEDITEERRNKYLEQKALIEAELEVLEKRKAELEASK
jgi:hypothetical protein